MSKYDTKSDEQIDQLMDDAFQRGWTACLNHIQQVKLEREERKRVAHSK